jgi:molybdenum cofactor sulfurtransferase
MTQLTLMKVLAAASIVMISWLWWRRRTCAHLKNSTSSSTSPSQLRDRIIDKAEFLERVGEKYGYPDSKKGFIDDWREAEFPSLIPPMTSSISVSKHRVEQPTEGEPSEPEVYLDFAGSALPTASQLSRIYNQSQILANPHSQGGGLASDRTLKLIQTARDRVMSHFGVADDLIDFDEVNVHAEKSTTNERNAQGTKCPGYQLVFTSGATDALRLLSERFPWGCHRISSPDGRLLSMQPKDNLIRNNTHIHQRIIANLPTDTAESIQIQSILVYPRNVHTSVVGMRNVVLERGARFRCVPVYELLNATTQWFEELVQVGFVYDTLPDHCTAAPTGTYHNEEKKDEGESSNANPLDRVPIKTLWVHHLLVLPVECNFGGDRYDWSSTITAARNASFSSYVRCTTSKTRSPAIGGKETMNNASNATTLMVHHKWHVLLDTAKAAATSPVNLTTMTHNGGPDFAVVSFYKLFGHPTGLGALFIKKKPSHANRVTSNQHASEDSGIVVKSRRNSRHYFGGGSVDVVLPNTDFVIPRNFIKKSTATHRIESDDYFGDEYIDLGCMVHGTEHFRGIADLPLGFQELDDLGGMDKVSGMLPRFVFKPEVW